MGLRKFSRDFQKRKVAASEGDEKGRSQPPRGDEIFLAPRAHHPVFISSELAGRGINNVTFRVEPGL